MTFFRRISLTVLALAMIALKSHAQSETADTLNIIQQIEAPGNITVTVPEGLVKLLSHGKTTEITTEEDSDSKSSAQTSKTTARVGYRIQVFDDNNVRTAKHEAQNRKRQIESRFPEYNVYTQFNSPYWRVKVGDFRTRSEAEAALAALRSAFPGYSSQLRVVRDRINATH